MRIAAMTGAIALLILSFGDARAQNLWDVQIYSGYQTAPHSKVSGSDGDGPFSFTAGWEGNSLSMPPYWGVRTTRWLGGNWGVGAEFTHTKVYADDATLAASGLSILEFTDGLNILTLNAVRRFPLGGAWTPYAGAGLGVAIPNVEYQRGLADPKTFDYQLTGPAVRLFAGVNYAVSDSWSVFAEYNGTYSQNEAELTGGGTLKTDIITNAVNFGVGFSF